MALTQITEKGIKDGEIINADINASAAIQGSKISPDFGSQNITTTGEVLIGTSTSQGNANANDLVVATSGHSGLTIRSGTSSNGNIFFADGTSGSDEYRGVIDYKHNGNSMSFSTDALERMRIDSSGNVGIGVTPTMAAGGGLHVRGPSGHQARLHMTTSNSGDTGNDGFYIIQQGAESTSNDTNFINYETANMKFSTSGSERMRIDSSGRLLLGTTTEGEATGDDLTIANSGDCGITIRSGTSSKAKLLFSDGTSGDAEYRGNIQYDHNGDYMKFSTAASEHLRINSTGHALFGTTTDSVYDDNSGSGVVIRGAHGAVDIKRNNDLLLNLNRVGGDGGIIRMIRDGATKADIGIKSSNLTVDVNGSERLRINSVGKVLIGMTTASTTTQGMMFDPGGESSIFRTSGINLLIGGGQVNQKLVEFRHDGTAIGNISKSGTTSTSYNTSSDYRLKENATAISDGITRLKTLKPYRFNFKIDPDKTVDGFFAHEVTAVPEAITGTKDETKDILYTEEDTIPSGKKVGDVKETVPAYQGIDQSKIVPLLTAALQEAVGKIETLETKVAALEAA